MRSYTWILLLCLGLALISCSEEQPKEQAPGTVESAASQKTDAPVTKAEQEQQSLENKVAGLVLDKDGKPLAGARVRVFRQLNKDYYQAPVLLERAIITGSSGRFVCRTDRQPNLLLEVIHGRHAKYNVAADARDPELRIRLQPGFRVHGQVIASDGQASRACQVALDIPAYAGSKTIHLLGQTDAAGRFVFRNLPPVHCVLTARHPDHRPVAQHFVPGSHHQAIKLQLQESGLFLQGQVFSGKETLAGAQVKAYRQDGPSIAENTMPFQASSDSEGVFQIQGLAPGRYSLRVTHPDHSTEQTGLSLQDSKADLEFVLQPRQQVKGHLFGAADPGQLSLELLAFDGEIHRCQVQADGSFDFGNPGVSQGWLNLRLQGGTYAFKKSSSQSLDLPRVDKDLELALEPAATLSGLVLDPQGQPLAGVRVMVRPLTRFFMAHGEAAPEVVAVTDQQGRFFVLGLPPGDVELFYQHQDYAWLPDSAVIPAAGSVELPARRLSLPGSIQGRIIRAGKPLAAAQVSPNPKVTLLPPVRTDQDGRYLLQALPPGEYRLRVQYSTLPVYVSDDAVVISEKEPLQDVSVELPPGSQVHGVVTDEGGKPISGAWIRGVMRRGVGVGGSGSGSGTSTDANGQFFMDLPPQVQRLHVQVGRRGSYFWRLGRTSKEAIQIELPLAAQGKLSMELGGDFQPGLTQDSRVLLRRQHQPALQILKQGFTKKVFELESLVQNLTGQDIEEWVRISGRRAELDELPAGEYSMQVLCQGCEPINHQVSIKAGQTLDLGRVELNRGASLRGKVLGKDGEPLADAKVWVQSSWDSSLRYVPGYYTCDPQGVFTATGIGPDSRHLIVHAKGYAFKSISLNLPGDLLTVEPLSLQLQPGATLRVQVQNAQGQSLATRKIWLSAQSKERRKSWDATTNKEGWAEFTHLAAGLYSVTLAGDIRSSEMVVIRDESGQQVYEKRLRARR